MRALGYLIAACMLMAVLQALAKLLVLAIGIAVVIGVLTKPRETFALLAFVVAAHLLN